MTFRRSVTLRQFILYDERSEISERDHKRWYRFSRPMCQQARVKITSHQNCHGIGLVVGVIVTQVVTFRFSFKALHFVI